MYCQFYGLKERPFNVTSDPDFFYFSRRHRDALSHLSYGVFQRKGIIVLTGEIGTGKTTLCRYLLNRLGKETKTALILNPYFSELELLGSIIRDFGLKIQDNTRLGLIEQLNEFLLNEFQAGNNVVLIVDEAQNLRPNLLEEIRLLSNLETDKEKLLQVILVGQPELSHRLNLHDLRQLRQRVMVRFHIGPLELDEVKSYIDHRLSIAGSCRGLEFCPEAVRLIAEFSQGTPRLINMACDRALLAGFASETSKIDVHVVRKALTELETYTLKE
ncbi:MAG: AAA family ATPase [Candidatus Omnitrophica bacterium]|nr:AAA family ATPase [Candidatus Omnitrophota bacterium]